MSNRLQTHRTRPGRRRGSPGRRTPVVLGAALGAILLLSTGCTREIDRSSHGSGAIGTGEIALVRADDCTKLGEAVSERARAIRRMQQAVGERLADGNSNAAGPELSDAPGPPTTMAPRMAVPSAGAADQSSAGTAAAPAPAAGGTEEAGSAIAGTNLQESGVDEGDMVKTDGKRLVALTADGTLRVVLLGEKPAVAGSVSVLHSAAATVGRRGMYVDGAGRGQVLLRGDEAVVIVPSSSPANGTPVVTLARVDLRDPRAPEVLERISVAGELVATRMAASAGSTTQRIRVVLRPFDAATVSPEAGTEVYPAPPETTTPPVTTPPDTVPSTTVPATVPGTRPTTTVAPETTTTADVSPSTTSPTTTSTAASRSNSGETMTAQVRALLPQEITADGTARTIGGCSDVFVEPAPDPTPAPDTPIDITGGQSGQNVSVLSIGESLAELSPVTVVGGADTAYATTDALYTTATVWGAGPAGRGATAVHRFDLIGAGPARYTGSGLVPGTVLDRYSMSDRDGALRIVTTATASASRPSTEAPGSTVPVNLCCSDAGSAPPPSIEGPGSTVPTVGGPESVEPAGPDSGLVRPPVDFVPVPRIAGRLAVLRPDDSGTLREVGHLDDIGVGEEVKSVRFLDDRAYVVTFRRTDPLFAIDLSNDTAPRILGELKLPGFSEYLHPLADGRLLGIGSEADAQTGRTTGFKATLFDVKDPTAPKELDSFVRPGISTIVGNDPHAFTWDPVRHQAIVPAAEEGAPRVMDCPPGAMCAAVGAVDEMGGGSVAGGSAEAPSVVPAPPVVPWSGAYVLGVDGDHLTLRGTLAHTFGSRVAQILRSVVVDSSIWTVSDDGVGRTDADVPTSITLQQF